MWTYWSTILCDVFCHVVSRNQFSASIVHIPPFNLIFSIRFILLNRNSGNVLQVEPWKHLLGFFFPLYFSLLLSNQTQANLLVTGRQYGGETNYERLGPLAQRAFNKQNSWVQTQKLTHRHCIRWLVPHTLT